MPLSLAQQIFDSQRCGEREPPRADRRSQCWRAWWRVSARAEAAHRADLHKAQQPAESVCWSSLVGGDAEPTVPAEERFLLVWSTVHAIDYPPETIRSGIFAAHRAKPTIVNRFAASEW